MPFQRASEEKLRTRRIVSVGGRFRRAAAETPDAPADETSRSTSIRYLNRQKYDMFNENCQYYSKAVAEECIRDEDRGNLAVV